VIKALPPTAHHSNPSRHNVRHKQSDYVHLPNRLVSHSYTSSDGFERL